VGDERTSQHAGGHDVGHGTIDTAIEATRIGAMDFLEKPIALQKLLATVSGRCAPESREPPCRSASRASAVPPPSPS